MRPEGFYDALNRSGFAQEVRDSPALVEFIADAMIEGLKAEGIRQLLQDPVLHYEHWHNNWGTIVFIGED